MKDFLNFFFILIVKEFFYNILFCRVDFVDDIVFLEIVEVEMEDEGEYILSLINDKGVVFCFSMVMV